MAHSISPIGTDIQDPASELRRIPLPRTSVYKGMKKGSEQLDPDPSSWPARVSQRYYFGPGHFGWLFWLSQGIALPLKCPEFPACGLSAKAATLPNDIVSAIASAAINNVMRFLIFSHPLSLIVLITIGPKRDAWRAKAHAIKPAPFAIC